MGIVNEPIEDRVGACRVSACAETYLRTYGFAGDKRLAEGLSMARPCEHADHGNVYSHRPFREVGSARICRGAKAAFRALQCHGQAGCGAGLCNDDAETESHSSLMKAGFVPSDSA